MTNMKRVTGLGGVFFKPVTLKKSRNGTASI